MRRLLLNSRTLLPIFLLVRINSLVDRRIMSNPSLRTNRVCGRLLYKGVIPTVVQDGYHVLSADKLQVLAFWRGELDLAPPFRWTNSKAPSMLLLVFSATVTIRHAPSATTILPLNLLFSINNNNLLKFDVHWIAECSIRKVHI